MYILEKTLQRKGMQGEQLPTISRLDWSGCGQK
jgi:hypothetical protein